MQLFYADKPSAYRAVLLQCLLPLHQIFKLQKMVDLHSVRSINRHSTFPGKIADPICMVSRYGRKQDRVRIHILSNNIFPCR